MSSDNEHYRYQPIGKLGMTTITTCMYYCLLHRATMAQSKIKWTSIVNMYVCTNDNYN